MVRFENVFFNHPSRTSGLKDISLTINKGDFVCIAAQTAEYKTTLLNLIYGTLLPVNGKLHVLEYVLPDDRKKIPEIRKQTGYVFHNFLFFENLTVRENLLLTLLIKSDKRKILNIEEKLEKLFKDYHFLKQDAIVANLSSGEKQLLNILRAIVFEPLIILADDPLKHLHKYEADLIMNLFEEEHRKGVTIIMTSGVTNMPESTNISYYTLKGGKLYKNDTDKSKSF